MTHTPPRQCTGASLPRGQLRQQSSAGRRAFATAVTVAAPQVLNIDETVAFALEFNPGYCQMNHYTKSM